MNAIAEDQFITLAQASAHTGLSVQTLKRFAEAEYFKSQKLDDDNILIHADDLFSVLNINPSKIKKNKVSTVADVSESPSATTAEPSPEPIAQVTAPDSPASELEKLRALTELHEKYIELKEQQIASITNERDWLRERIEKLEAKTERDQLILVSMSETHRGMLKQLENKKSTMQLALEWLGINTNPAKD